MLTSCYICDAIPSAPITFKRLLPPGAPGSVEEIVTGFGLHEQPPVPLAALGRLRPYLLLNMVSTLDGRATITGRSGPISGHADRELFHGLRSVVDAVMAGAGTVRVERYGPIVPDPARQRLRSQRGMHEQPLACIVSESLTFDPELPLLCDQHSHVAILTASAASLPTSGAQVEYVRARSDDGLLDLPMALAELQDRLQIHTLLCEGGPHLNAQLLSAGLVDELFLSVAPKLAGGDLIGGETSSLRILAGADFDPPLELKLLEVLESSSHLFLRYGVLGGR